MRQGASSASECQKCGAGVFCESSGTQELCDEGFVCYGASTTARPTDGEKGQMCPKGSYCPRGTANPRVCSIGTFGPTVGLGAACEPCPAGRLCDVEGKRCCAARIFMLQSTSKMLTSELQCRLA